MSAQAYKRWICEACGFIYDEAEGDPDSGLAPGTRYEDIPDDWACPLCGMAKSDLRLLPDAPVISGSRPKPAATGKQSKGSEDHVVIVGGGVAGWSVAEAIRRGDTGTPVLLITACKGLVYPKPAISIAMSQGKSADDLVDKDGETRAAELDIELRPGVRVLKIDAARKRLVTARGSISYGKLVLALGAKQRQLPIDGDAADAVVSINDLASYRSFRESMDRDGMHITILGAGLIGCEFANDLVKAGHRVSVIDPADQPLSSLVPIELGEGLKTRLAKEGVEWIFGETLKSVSRIDDGFKAGLSSGRMLDTDLVLSAAGLVPNISLAKRSGLDVDRGISVSPDMLTSDPDIYALGDCASVEGKVYAFIEPIRRQATAIAGSIAGRQAAFEQTPPLVRVKTSSMPICVSFFGDSAGQVWQKVGDQSSGLHFEAKQGEEVTGFAVSDVLANNAGSLYQEMTG